MADAESGPESKPTQPEREPDGYRREFVVGALGFIGVFYIGASAYPVYRYLVSPVLDAKAGEGVNRMPVPEAGKLKNGSAMLFAFGSKPALLIHHLDGSWVCFNATCTHLDCTVQFQPEQKRLFCACHEGVFDPVTGKAVSGPPKTALKQYRVEVIDGEIIVSRC